MPKVKVELTRGSHNRFLSLVQLVLSSANSHDYGRCCNLIDSKFIAGWCLLVIDAHKFVIKNLHSLTPGSAA